MADLVRSLQSESRNPNQETKMQYEYNIVRMDYAPKYDLKQDESVLNSHGKEGWELIQVIGPLVVNTPEDCVQSGSLVYVMKRPKV